MILLDAYALVAFLAGERAAAEVGGLLRGGEVAIPAPNLAETHICTAMQLVATHPGDGDKRAGVADVRARHDLRANEAIAVGLRSRLTDGIAGAATTYRVLVRLSATYPDCEVHPSDRAACRPRARAHAGISSDHSAVLHLVRT